MPSPVIIVVGAGALSGFVDVLTQFLEVRLKRGPGLPPSPHQPPEPLSGQSQEEDEDGAASTGYYSQFTEVPMNPALWDWRRTLRMTVVGTIQGAINTGILMLVQSSFSNDLSVETALKKSLFRLALQPLFFCLGTVCVEVLKEGHFRSVVPKIHQDFGTAMILSLFSFPVSVVIYLCTNDVVYQALLGIVPDFVFSMANNMVMNRGLKAWHPGHGHDDHPPGKAGEAPPAEELAPDHSEFFDARSATVAPSRVSWGGAEVIK
eukprot:EG_transcript_16638